MELKICIDFSKTPGPRYAEEGLFSGEIFRKKFLTPRLKEAIAKGEVLIVNLDGTAGYGTSFLEESFGGLIREEGFNYSDVKKYLKIISEEEDYLKDDINDDIDEAQSELGKN